jgi:hypothetical protein
MIPELALSRSVNYKGTIILDNQGKQSRIPVEVLFDSGSVNASFISKAFIDQHRDVWDGRYKENIGWALLADKITKIKVYGFIVVPCSFEWKEVEYAKKIKIFVVDTLSCDMIIGLPHIILHYLDLFIELLRTALDRALQLNESTPEIQAVHSYGDESFMPVEKEPGLLYNPWTTIDGEAPEDVDIEMPCSFSYALHYMELPYDEAVKEYCDLIETHASEDFLRAVPALRGYLTDVAIKRFIPTNWQ